MEWSGHRNNVQGWEAVLLRTGGTPGTTSTVTLNPIGNTVSTWPGALAAVLGNSLMFSGSDGRRGLETSGR